MDDSRVTHGQVENDTSPGYSEGWADSPAADHHFRDDDRDGGGSPGDDSVDSYGGTPFRRQSASPDDAAKNFKVVIRVRPPLPRELHGDRPFQNTVRVDTSETSITVSENLAALDESGTMTGPYSSHSFTFDHVYDQNCDQRKVYETTAKAVVESSLKGYNATIFAYGQTGTGKTYTMEGFNSAEERGIIPRAIEQIFKHIQSSVSPRMRFLVRASYLQIYNEVISDLLKPERANLAIREDKKRGVFVEGLSEWVVRSPAEIYGLMERGGAMRATGSTRMNEISSRSHAVFMIITEQSETTYVDEAGTEMSPEDFARMVKSAATSGSGVGSLKALETSVRQSFKVGKLNLVDLAGSERVRLTGATGQRLEESKKINQSLSALGNVIAALTDPRGRQHIPYRDSKLTRILEDSLGGNCKTTMMAMVSPALEAFVESLSTLKFANRAKNIKNEARVNEDLDQKSLLRRYERELKRLRAELEERSRNVVDGRKLLQLEEERRRAEEDKMAAIRALEARSREFMREKAEKKRLEERITLLQGQVLQGGADKEAAAAALAQSLGPVQDTPAFRNAIKEHQERIRAEYEARLAELEKERETIEEEKAQVDRYKQLLLKQRDIMILLTQRLNERDEQIVALQDELDAYDRQQRELEETLDEKTAALIHLQRVTMEHNAASPVKNTELVEALGDWAAGGAGRAGRSGGGIGNIGATSATPRGVGINVGQAATKMYRSGDSGNGVSSPVLLTADEKIGELIRLSDAAKADRDRLSRELEDVRAEKVSMEYLLREKLEKLVQSEIEARLAAYKRGDADASGSEVHSAALVRQLQSDLSQRTEELATARAEAAAADEEARRLRRRVAIADASPPTASSAAVVAASAPESASVAALRERLAVHQKERRAIHTIMELKIKTLVDGIASAASAAAAAVASPTGTASAGGGSGVPPSPGGGPPPVRLLREVQALQRLVNASITALRNSEAEVSSPPSQSGVQSSNNGSAEPSGSSGTSPAISSTPSVGGIGTIGASISRVAPTRQPTTLVTPAASMGSGGSGGPSLQAGPRGISSTSAPRW